MYSSSYYSNPIDDFLAAFFGTFFLILLFAFAFGILVYVLQSLGFYTMAKNRNIPNPWLAWIPYGNLYLLGELIDDIVLGIKGAKVILLVLGFANVGLAIGAYFPLIDMMINPYNVSTDLAIMFFFFLLEILIYVVNIAAYYRLFKGYTSNAVLFTVLTAIPLTSIITPFVIFAIRNNVYNPNGYSANNYQNGNYVNTNSVQQTIMVNPGNNYVNANPGNNPNNIPNNRIPQRPNNEYQVPVGNNNPNQVPVRNPQNGNLQGRAVGNNYPNNRYPSNPGNNNYPRGPVNDYPNNTNQRNYPDDNR